MNKPRVGVIGATSLVGLALLPQLVELGFDVVAYSRRKNVIAKFEGVNWQQLNGNDATLQTQSDIHYWICVAPLWVLSELFDFLVKSGVRRVVVLSSTSRFTKSNSSNIHEQQLACRLSTGEGKLQEWAESRNIEWIILRPTLIYGFGRDKNIAEIARFIRHLGFFPLLGKANGLRQPIHATDVAGACIAALFKADVSCLSYNITGSETITYRDMVSRIFGAMDRPVRIFSIPLWFFQLAVLLLRVVPRYSHWSSAMAERMNQDLVFDNSFAESDLGFKPKMFFLAAEDI